MWPRANFNIESWNTEHMRLAHMVFFYISVILMLCESSDYSISSPSQALFHQKLILVRSGEKGFLFGRFSFAFENTQNKLVG